MNAYEQKTVDFLNAMGLRTVKIPESDARSADYEVYRGDTLVFYAEVKGQPRREGDFCGPDPTYNRLTQDIHTAYKQLSSSNPKHAVPNVLVLVNQDITVDVRDLDIVVTGKTKLDTGEYLEIFGKYAFGRIACEKTEIDMYVWIQSTGSTDKYFFRSVPGPHNDRVRSALGLPEEPATSRP